MQTLSALGDRSSSTVAVGAVVVVGAAVVVVGATVVVGAAVVVLLGTVVVGAAVVVLLGTVVVGAAVVVGATPVVGLAVVVVDGAGVVVVAGGLVVGGAVTPVVTRAGALVVGGAVTPGAVVTGADVAGRVAPVVVGGAVAGEVAAGPGRRGPPLVADLPVGDGSAPVTAPIASPASPKPPGAGALSSRAAGASAGAAAAWPEVVRGREGVDPEVGGAVEDVLAGGSAAPAASVDPGTAVLDVDEGAAAASSPSPSPEGRVVGVRSEVATLNGSGPGSSTRTPSRSAIVPNTMATFTWRRSYHGVMAVPTPVDPRRDAIQVQAHRHLDRPDRVPEHEPAVERQTSRRTADHRDRPRPSCRFGRCEAGARMVAR